MINRVLVPLYNLKKGAVFIYKGDPHKKIDVTPGWHNAVIKNLSTGITSIVSLDTGVWVDD